MDEQDSGKKAVGLHGSGAEDEEASVRQMAKEQLAKGEAAMESIVRLSSLVGTLARTLLSRWGGWSEPIVNKEFCD